MSSANAGRPRDPEVDRRLRAAAVDLYGEVGWAGFTVDALSRRSGVGKASIYLRWESKDELFIEAIQDHFQPVTVSDGASTRSELIELARQLLRTHLGPTGRAFLRLVTDELTMGGIRTAYEEWGESRVRAAREIVARGIERGDIPPATSITLVLDTICGGALNHALSTPPRLRDVVLAQADEYAVKLVDFVLAASHSPVANSAPA
jgi:AcrR family transcriptional regulator